MAQRYSAPATCRKLVIPVLQGGAPPERSITLREEHEGIFPGYHMNKKHWNTVLLDGSVPTKLIRELIDQSYGLVAKALNPKH